MCFSRYRQVLFSAFLSILCLFFNCFFIAVEGCLLPLVQQAKFRVSPVYSFLLLVFYLVLQQHTQALCYTLTHLYVFVLTLFSFTCLCKAILKPSPKAISLSWNVWYRPCFYTQAITSCQLWLMCTLWIAVLFTN